MFNEEKEKKYTASDLWQIAFKTEELTVKEIMSLDDAYTEYPAEFHEFILYVLKDWEVFTNWVTAIDNTARKPKYPSALYFCKHIHKAKIMHMGMGFKCFFDLNNDKKLFF